MYKYKLFNTLNNIIHILYAFTLFKKKKKMFIMIYFNTYKNKYIYSKINWKISIVGI